MEIRLSDAEKLFLIHGAEDNYRNDGRRCEDFREIILERGVLSGPDGSCRVQLGRTTDVLAGVKLELEAIDPEDSEKPHQPIVFFVDFSANASSQFAGKGGDKYAEELSAALQTAYGKSLDLLPNIKKTILAKSHRWKIYADVTVLQWDGSALDAASIAVIGALSDVQIPEVNIQPDDGGKVIIALHRPKTGENCRDEDVPVATWQLDTARCPLVLSVAKIGTANLVDCTPEEETCVRAQICCAFSLGNEKERNKQETEITMVKQISGGLLELESINDMLDVGVRVARRLHDSLHIRFKNETLRKPGASFLS